MIFTGKTYFTYLHSSGAGSCPPRSREDKGEDCLHLLLLIFRTFPISSSCYSCVLSLNMVGKIQENRLNYFFCFAVLQLI